MSEALLENRDYCVILVKNPSENIQQSPLPTNRWQAVATSIVALASKCAEFDPDGITVYIAADSIKKHEQVKEDQIALLFQEFQETAHPVTSSLAKALETELDDYFARKAARQTKENGEIIIVVTDEEPKERQAVVKAIVNSTKKIDRDEELGIGFAQIGEHSLTQGFFSAVDDDLHVAGADFDIVDTKILDTIKFNQFITFLMNIINE